MATAAFKSCDTVSTSFANISGRSESAGSLHVARVCGVNKSGTLKVTKLRLNHDARSEASHERELPEKAINFRDMEIPHDLSSIRAGVPAISLGIKQMRDEESQLELRDSRSPKTLAGGACSRRIEVFVASVSEKLACTPLHENS